MWLTDNACSPRGLDPCLQQVVSGESGAGKSETTKFLVRHLMDLCQSGRTALEENIREVRHVPPIPPLFAITHPSTWAPALEVSASRLVHRPPVGTDLTPLVAGVAL